MNERYAVIGHPVAHSKSPWIHAEFARACGQDIEYTRIEAPLDGFAAAVDAFRAAAGSGLNVTLPFKEAACLYCGDCLSPRARGAGVVNTLVFEGTAGPKVAGDDTVRGDNTDGIGLVRDLSINLGLSLTGKRVLLMGAGGAAQGVAGELLEAGVRELVIANRTAAKAEAIAARFPGSRGGGYEGLAGESFDIVVNATSAGLAGEAASLPAGVLRKGMLAYDMVYGLDTPFLAAARQAGAHACDGLGMLVEQAAESFFVWRGVRPDTRPVLAKLRAA